MQRRNIQTFTRASALLLLFAASAAVSAAQLSFAHLAQRAGTAHFQLDGQDTATLAYREAGPLLERAAGVHHIRVLHADGHVLAQGELTLPRNGRELVLLAGNGSSDAPYELRRSTDHNHPLFAGQRSLQEASLAIPRPAPTLLSTRLLCPGRPTANPRRQGYGDGTAPLAAATASGGVSIGPAGGNCVEQLLEGADAVLDEIPHDARAGDRQRRFVIGDGVNEPYALWLLTQGREPIQTVMTPDASLEGLWYPPGAPAGTGLQLAYDPGAAPGRQLSAILFGYENATVPRWQALLPSTSNFPGQNRLTMVEYRGDPDGVRAAIGFEIDGAMFIPHSCGEMTMLGTSGSRSGIVPAHPRDAIRFHKLFPSGCSAPATRK
jgi:hypothetical protein